MEGDLRCDTQGMAMAGSELGPEASRHPAAPKLKNELHQG